MWGDRIDRIGDLARMPGCWVRIPPENRQAVCHLNWGGQRDVFWHRARDSVKSQQITGETIPGVSQSVPSDGQLRRIRTNSAQSVLYGGEGVYGACPQRGDGVAMRLDIEVAEEIIISLRRLR